MRNSPLLLLLGIAGCAVTEPPPPAEALHVRTLASDGQEDWFEVVNTSDQAIELDDFVFVDVEGDLERAAGFPAVTLGPGESYVQRVSRATHGFQLAPGEDLFIYLAGG